MRETQDCDGNGLVIGFSSDAVYEAAINFQLGDRQSLEVGQR